MHRIMLDFVMTYYAEKAKIHWLLPLILKDLHYLTELLHMNMQPTLNYITNNKILEMSEMRA